MAYSCVQHLKRGSVHLRDSSRRVARQVDSLARRTPRRCTSPSVPPTTKRRLGAARQAERVLARSPASELTARPSGTADVERQNHFFCSSAKTHRGIR